MDDLFNQLSSSTRINKNKRRKPNTTKTTNQTTTLPQSDVNEEKNHSPSKLAQIHSEAISAFRRRLHIKIFTSSTCPDPITSFSELTCPTWCSGEEKLFLQVKSILLKNVQQGKWMDPTPIQMQTIPSLLQKRDILACAPTGSGKSGAFIIPSLFLSSIATQSFYSSSSGEETQKEVRSIFLAPSRELASQLHRETSRLGSGKIHAKYILLSKSNIHQVTSSISKHGVDVLISTPLRLLDTLQSHPHLLSRIRLMVLDEADRLLDSTTEHIDSKTFLHQMDDILAYLPPTAIRALFSATITPSVQHLSESILRSPIRITVTPPGGVQGGANPDITQKLLYVGKEEGKLLAIRQRIAKGLNPPVLIFLESKERAAALHRELMYEPGAKVDVIHSDLSLLKRERSIDKFRRGESWILITTDVCARGVDFKHVQSVINYDIPENGIVYTHRIGRTGRAGRKGDAVTFFTEEDVSRDNGEGLRKIVNVMKLSGADVPHWLLGLGRKSGKKEKKRKRGGIDTTPSYDKKRQYRKKMSIENTKKKKTEKHDAIDDDNKE